MVYRINDCSFNVRCTFLFFSIQVKLKDSLMSSVNFSQAKDAELAWVDGEIHFSSATSKNVVGEGENDAEKTGDLVPVLDALPSNLVCLCMYIVYRHLSVTNHCKCLAVCMQEDNNKILIYRAVQYPESITATETIILKQSIKRDLNVECVH